MLLWENTLTLKKTETKGLSRKIRRKRTFQYKKETGNYKDGSNMKYNLDNYSTMKKSLNDLPKR